MASSTLDILDCASAQWIGKRREQEDVVKVFPPPAGRWALCATAWEGIFAGIVPPVW